jgi:hypothetical protein
VLRQQGFDLPKPLRRREQVEEGVGVALFRPATDLTALLRERVLVRMR